MSDDKTIIADAGMLHRQPASRNPACLVQYSGTGMGKRYPLKNGEVSVGRTPEAGIFIGDSSVSRAHARFIVNGSQVLVEDLGSSNGTFCNDKRTEGSVKLQDQDMLRLGNVLLKFFAEGNLDGMIQDKIYRMATIDAGTGIFNKKYLLDTLDSEFQNSRASGRSLSIIYFDLDHFKKVNDTYGHNAGDLVLKTCADIVKGITRKDDTFGRFGGEEFIIILPNTDARTAYELAERVRLAIASHVFQFNTDVNNNQIDVQHKQTVSLGVSQLSADMTKGEDFLEAADRKLFYSKQNGRNKVTV